MLTSIEGYINKIYIYILLAIVIINTSLRERSQLQRLVMIFKNAIWHYRDSLINKAHWFQTRRLSGNIASEALKFHSVGNNIK